MQKTTRGFYSKIDSSVIFLIISNLFTIFIAFIEKWDFITLVWIYWFQSVIISTFNFIRILNLKNFTTEGVLVNKMPIPPTHFSKIFIAIFFAIHYGFFHLGYLIFIFAQTFQNKTQITNILFVFVSIIIFLINHLFSFYKNLKKDTEKKQNIGRVMLFPYARIIPMHIIIVMGLLINPQTNSLILFLILKTIADVIMHQIEHV